MTTSTGHASRAQGLRVIPRFLYFPPSLLAIVAAAIGWPNTHWATMAAWISVAAYGMFCWTSCFHEAAHHTLAGSRWFSVLVGRFIGTAIFVPYTCYRESHIRHHAYLNKPSDWELWPYSDPNSSIWFRRVFCWLEIPLGLFTSPIAYGRLYFHRNSPLSPSIRRTIRNEYLFMLFAWGTILGLVAWSGTWVNFLRCWVIPHWIAGVIQTGRKFTEHLGLSSYDPLLGARTVIGQNFITRICCFLNFDIFVHGVHHRHPRYPHDRLVNRMENYRTEHPGVEYPVFGSYMSAVRHMLPAVIRNPGVGMNAGAEAPTEDKADDVNDFVEDVSKEILDAGDLQNV